MKINNFKWIVVVIVIGTIAYSFGCGRKKTDSEKMVARVDNYYMTIEDFKDRIKHSSHGTDEIQDLEQLLDLAIGEQVLIQEAQRQELDRQRSFMKTIERYWAQTLIKELIEKQSYKIRESVSDREKQQEALNDWINELHKKADIKINKKVLQELKQE